MEKYFSHKEAPFSTSTSTRIFQWLWLMRMMITEEESLKTGPAR